MKTKNTTSSSGLTGFTLIELLAVIGIIAILASLLLPALGLAKRRAQSSICQSNLKQLNLAWEMYHGDNDDHLAPDYGRGFGRDGWRSLAGSWVTGSAFTDTTSSNIQAGVLFPHAGSDQIYRCPSDQSTVRDEKIVRRFRHYSMSLYMNPGGDAIPVMVGLGMGSRGLGKASAIHEPSKIFVFIHHHPDSISAGGFPVRQPGDWIWVNFPYTQHQGGCNLSFADGHVEFRKWKESRTIEIGKGDTWGSQPTVPGDRDLAWLQERIPAPQYD